MQRRITERFANGSVVEVQLPRDEVAQGIEPRRRVQMQPREPLREIVGALFDSDNSQFDLTESAIETLDTLEDFGANLFEPQHRAQLWQRACRAQTAANRR